MSIQLEQEKEQCRQPKTPTGGASPNKYLFQTDDVLVGDGSASHEADGVSPSEDRVLVEDCSEEDDFEEDLFSASEDGSRSGICWFFPP